MRYAMGFDERGETYALRDPRETEIAALVERAGRDATAVAGALLSLPGLFPEALIRSPAWRPAIENRLRVMVAEGMAAAIAAEARACRA